MKRPMSSELVSPGTLLEECSLTNDRVDLRVIPEWGAHWSRLRIAAKGRWLDLLRPVADSASAHGENRAGTFEDSGCFFMAPWTHRIASASFSFGDTSYRLLPSHNDGTAMHGDVRSRPWKVVRQDANRIEVCLDSWEFEDFNYPFRLAFTQTLELLPEGVRASAFIRNADRNPAPVGFGYHPFFRRCLTPKDRDVVVVVPASHVYPSRACLPISPAEPVAGGLDLRDPSPLGDREIDECFTGLSEGCLRIFYPGTGVQVRLCLDPIFSHAVVYAPRSRVEATEVSASVEATEICTSVEATEVDRILAVEPVTQANDGLNCLARGWPHSGVRILEPGERWGGSWELTVGDI